MNSSVRGTQGDANARNRIAVVQPCIWPGDQQKDAGQVRAFAKLEKLTTDAAASSPSLVVWPETAVLNLQASPLLRRRIDDLSGKSGAALLVGASQRVKFTGRPAGDPPGRAGCRFPETPHRVPRAARVFACHGPAAGAA